VLAYALRGKNESKTGFCFHAVFCNRLRLMREKYAKKVSAIANERARRNRAVEDLDNHCDKLAVDRKGRFCQVISNSHRHDRHDTDGTVLSCLMWRCELCRPDRQTGAFCVRYASECVGRLQRSRSSQHSRQGICERGLTVHCACPTIDKWPHCRQRQFRLMQSAAVASSYQSIYLQSNGSSLTPKLHERLNSRET